MLAEESERVLENAHVRLVRLHLEKKKKKKKKEKKKKQQKIENEPVESFQLGCLSHFARQMHNQRAPP